MTKNYFPHLNNNPNEYEQDFLDMLYWENSSEVDKKYYHRTSMRRLDEFHEVTYYKKCVKTSYLLSIIYLKNIYIYFLFGH